MQKKELKVVVNNSVVMRNDLARSLYVMSRISSELLTIILSELHWDDKDFKPVLLTRKQILSDLSCGRKSVKLITVKEIEKAIDNLGDINIHIPKDITVPKDYDENNRRCSRSFKKWYGFISSVEYSEELDSYRIVMNNDLKDYLLDLGNHFTKEKKSKLLGLGMKFGLHFYMFLKSYVGMVCAEQRQVSVDYLQRLFDSNTSDFSSFRRRILDPNIAKINEVMDIRVSYDLIKARKRVIAIQFNVVEVQS